MDSWDDYGEFAAQPPKSGAKSNPPASGNKNAADRLDKIETHADLGTVAQNEELAQESVGKRAVGYKIMKNRGQKARKAKENRNPRVKKRMKYERALKQLNSIIRPVKPLEGHYLGELSGIRDDVSKSRKFA